MRHLFLGALLAGAPVLMMAQNIGFETLAKATRERSPLLQKEALQVDLAHEAVVQAKSVYYPTLRLGLNAEYSKKFHENSTSTYVGEESLTQATRYQNSATLSLSYDVFRFGAKGQGVQAALAKVDTALARQCLAEKELLLRLLSVYHQLRLSQLKHYYHKVLSGHYAALYQATKRLHASGFLVQTEVMHYAKKVADAVVEHETIKEEHEKLLAEATYISGVFLDTSAQFLPLERSNEPFVLPTFEESFQAKQLLASIREKEAELRIAKTKTLPAVSFYGKYDLYGQDVEEYGRSVDTFRRNGYRVGLSFSWNLFDGFAKESAIATRLLELQQARFGLEEAKREFTKEWTLLKSQQDHYKAAHHAAKDAQHAAATLAGMGEKLHQNGEVDKMTALQHAILETEATRNAEETQEKYTFKVYEEALRAQKEFQCVAP